MFTTILLAAMVVGAGCSPIGRQSFVAPCSPCSPGFEVQTPCTESHDTICAKCPLGTYSNSTDFTPCFQCSRCGKELFELHPCTTKNDVFCEICSWEYAKDNEDYKKRCLKNNHRKPTDDKGNKIKKGYRAFLRTGGLIPKDQPSEPVNGIEPQSNDSAPTTWNNDVVTEESEGIVESKKTTPSPSTGNNNLIWVHLNTNETTDTPVEEQNKEVKNNTSISIQASTIHPGGASSETSLEPDLLPVTDKLDNARLVQNSTVVPTESGSGAMEENPTETVGFEGSGDISELLMTTEESIPHRNASTLKTITKSTTHYIDKETTPSQRTEVKLSTHRYNLVGTRNSTINGTFIPFVAMGANTDGKTEDNGSSTFGIVMAVLTAGVIFFSIGFFISRKKDKEQFKPQKGAHDDNEMVPLEGYRVSNLQSSQVAALPGQEPDLKMPLVSPPIGKYQSPVDIDPEEADVDETLEKNVLFYRYLPQNTKSITNTGSALRLDVDGTDSQLRGGPLSNRYQLDHVHFHWGSTDDHGSEHTIKGTPYSAEIHLVHWNTDLYNSFAEAIKAENGLTVLAVLVEVGISHFGLKTITDLMPTIRYKGESQDIKGAYFDPGSLLPDNTIDYWTYQGSLTTPPFYETVNWIVFKDTLEISREQLDAFRSLLSYERDEGHSVSNKNAEGHILDNFRQTLPLGDRVVKASFL